MFTFLYKQLADFGSLVFLALISTSGVRRLSSSLSPLQRLFDLILYVWALHRPQTNPVQNIRLSVLFLNSFVSVYRFFCYHMIELWQSYQCIFRQTYRD